MAEDPNSQMQAAMAGGPETPGISDLQKQAIANQGQQANNAASNISGAISNNESFTGTGQENNFISGLGGVQTNIGQSITNAVAARNVARANDYVNNLKQNIGLNSAVINQAGMQGYAQSQQQAQQIQNNNYATLQQYNLDANRVNFYQQQQTDGILGSILGAVGAIGGAVLGAALPGAKK
jgi:hypothetical protein